VISALESEEASAFDPIGLSPSRAVARYRLIGNHWIRYRFARQFVSNLTVLEFGCGYGVGSSLLLDSVKSYTGVDVHRPGVRWAESNFGDARGNVEFLTLDEFDQSSSNERFDVALGFEVIEHVQEPTRLLSAMVRRVRPGGKLILSTPNGFYSQHRRELFRTPFHFDEYEPSQLHQLLLPYSKSVTYFVERRRDGLDVLFLRRRLRKMHVAHENAAEVKSAKEAHQPSSRSLRSIAWAAVYHTLNGPAFWEIQEVRNSIPKPEGFSTIIAVSTTK
jgi:2-polyprenyl-3-methyl-5-hydroxy-6-metoxy-1,4-benzoquinol methylase